MFDSVATDSPFVGIAKLARSSPLVGSKSRVEYFELPTRRYLGRCSGSRMPFEWTINPYRGCEFGCQYCYARYTHEFMELGESRQFERMIFAKQWNALEFRRELRAVPRGEAIALGTATDPYQPAERRFFLTRKMLEVFAGERGHRLSITTKSDLVARDIGVLQEVARANILHVGITVTTLDPSLAALLEPLAPRPDLRLAAVKKLAEAGIRAGVLAMPMLPLLNDSEESIDALAAAAESAGAHFFAGAPVFLKECAKEVFFPFLEEHFPHLAGKYRERFAKGAYVTGHYAEMLRQRIRAARSRYGLPTRAEDYEPELWPVEPQMELFG